MLTKLEIGTMGTFSPSATHLIKTSRAKGKNLWNPDALRLSPERQKSADEALLFSFILADYLKRTLQGDYWLKCRDLIEICLN